jgi:translocation and assembly module TamB
VDLRVDQSPGIWMTAVGVVPTALFDTSLPPEPIELSLKSSGIDLTLLQGMTGVVRNLSGGLLVDIAVVGTSRDPHFTGTLAIQRAAFEVVATGARYKNGNVALRLAEDRVNVEAFHVEDVNGHALDLRGSLGTHELKVGDFRIDAEAHRFELVRDEFGRVDVDAAVQLRGEVERPRIIGDVTIQTGELNVDEILQRTMFQPYATEPTVITPVGLAGADAIAALNPWDRLGLDLALHVPNTLRLSGQNVQLAPGTPVGIGNMKLRVAGDLYFYKDPGDLLYVSGALDSINGTFTFQGRPFDVDPASSIIFRGDLNPDLYVGVTRVISGVETRVTFTGPLHQPELRLTSTPPLDESDILSLIVFNTSTNQLSAVQQQELFVRAGTLAAGFVATPILSAIETELGLNLLEVEPSGDFGLGPKLTVGEEIVPGLVARFSRQFGSEPYDEATIEYYLSRILRLRATFSDAQSLSVRSPFRRVERAGIDLLFFFSF